jgi:hypothetical protein
MTLTAGIHPGIAAEDYHADPCPEPSLSAHDAQTILARSPRHAWHDHPRLNPARERDEPTAQQEEGTALHAFLFEQDDRVETVDAKDWRGGDAQKARKAARAAGRVALLTHRWDELRGTAEAMRQALAGHEIGDFLARPGRPEVTMLWQDESEAGPLWCRSRPDWMPDDMPVLIDLKTTEGTADPEAWSRTALRDGLPLRVTHYLRGAFRLGIRKPRYLIVVLERNPPFGVSVLELAPSLLTMADEQHQAARNVFAACLRDGDWPSYPPFVATIEAPSWLAYSHEDWKQRAAQAAERRRAPKPFLHQASNLIAAAIRDGGEPFA